jgi:hypothetical protein
MAANCCRSARCHIPEDSAHMYKPLKTVGKDLEDSGPGLIAALPMHLCGWMRKTVRNLSVSQPVTRLGFEPTPYCAY